MGGRGSSWVGLKVERSEVAKGPDCCNGIGAKEEGGSMGSEPAEVVDGEGKDGDVPVIKLGNVGLGELGSRFVLVSLGSQIGRRERVRQTRTWGLSTSWVTQGHIQGYVSR